MLLLLWKMTERAPEQARQQPDSPLQWQQRAKQRLRAAQLSLEGLGASSRVNELREQLQRLEQQPRASVGPSTPPVPMALLAHLRRSSGSVALWLRDWTRPHEGPSVSPVSLDELVDAALQPLLDTGSSAPDLDEGDVLLPAAALMQARTHLSADKLSACSAAITGSD